MVPTVYYPERQCVCRTEREFSGPYSLYFSNTFETFFDRNIVARVVAHLVTTDLSEATEARALPSSPFKTSKSFQIV